MVARLHGLAQFNPTGMSLIKLLLVKVYRPRMCVSLEVVLMRRFRAPLFVSKPALRGAAAASSFLQQTFKLRSRREAASKSC